MKRRRRSNFVSILFILASYFIFANVAEAESIVRLNQAKVRLIIPPGSSKTGIIKVENPSPEPKHVRIYIEDWVYLPECDGAKDFQPAGTTELSAADWINFVPSELDIPAYGSESLSYTVRVPTGAKGGHYAVLFFESYLSDQKMTSEGVSVNFAVRVASLFYIEPEGTISRQVKIDNLLIDKREGKFYISAKFSNIGNVDITAKGTFFILDPKGMVYARGEFNDVYTLPGNTATLLATWKEPIPKGKYDLVLTIDIGRALEELNLGRGPVITKEAKIEMGENGEAARLGELK